MRKASWQNSAIGSGGIKTQFYIYMTQDDSVQPFQQATELLSVKFSETKLYKETSRDFLVYRKVKALIEKDDGILLIQSLEGICSSRKEIPEELRLLIESPIRLIILDYPVMFKKLDLETNHLFLQLLREIYQKPRNRLKDLRAERSKRLGRHKITYPENWELLYEKWQAGRITGLQFMREAHLKRGTFYHMAAEYKEYLTFVKKQFGQIE